MFVNNKNLTDEINELIAEGAKANKILTSDIVDDFISEDEHSAAKNLMQKAVDYYLVETDIGEKERTYYYKGVKKTDDSKPNNRLAHAWHTFLVDQKIAYLLAKSPTFSDKDATVDDEDNKISPNEEFVEYVKEILDETFADDLNDLGTGASNKGVEWLHPYIDKEKEGINELKYKVIDARECIPIWKTKAQNELEAMIRYYKIQWAGEEVYKAEFWTPKQVQYFIQDPDSGEYRPDTITEDEAIQDHFYYNEDGYGWDKVPFIPFKNNKDMLSDLKLYKTLADDYDKKASARADDIEEIQEAIDILRGYQGTDLAEYQHNKRHYKVIKLDKEGGYDQETTEIPTKAHEAHLNRLDEDITTFGQGVNPKSDKFGNNPSGVSIKFLYAALDLKANKMERKFQRAFNQLFWFISEYLYMTGLTTERYSPNVVKVTFNKTMIANETELIKSVNQSKGVIDDKSIFENHPLVSDPEKAQRRYEQQQTGFGQDNRVQEELENMANEELEL